MFRPLPAMPRPWPAFIATSASSSRRRDAGRSRRVRECLAQFIIERGKKCRSGNEMSAGWSPTRTTMGPCSPDMPDQHIFANSSGEHINTSTLATITTTQSAQRCTSSTHYDILQPLATLAASNSNPVVVAAAATTTVAAPNPRRSSLPPPSLQYPPSPNVIRSPSRSSRESFQRTSP